MPVLLLARGDQDSRSLLRRAIEARYGLAPPTIESLRLELKGRSRAKIGPVATWVSLEGIAYFKFPFSVRWNFTTHAAGLVHTEHAEAFNNAASSKQHGSQFQRFEDAEHVASARARLWAINTLLLMPLSEPHVELRATGERSLDAINHDCELTAHLQLNDDHTLAYTSAMCLNNATQKIQTYTLSASDGQAIIGGLMLPGKITISWDNHPETELKPVAAEINPPLDDALFEIKPA
jgi:hypothetical protein